ncbi:hypothetical protein ACFL08_02790 [Patescibacteria group bacterium]
MNKFFKKNKHYIWMITFLIVIILLASLVVPYFLKKINETSNRTQEIVVENENNLDILTELPSIRMEFNETQGKLGELREFFSEDKMVSLAESLEAIALATDNNIEISVIPSAKPGKSAKKIDEKMVELLKLEEGEYLKININLQGSYEGLIKYLQGLKGVKYHNEVVSMNMESFDENKDVSVGTLYEKRFLPKVQSIASEENVEKAVVFEKGVISNIGVIFYLKKD